MSKPPSAAGLGDVLVHTARGYRRELRRAQLELAPALVRTLRIVAQHGYLRPGQLAELAHSAPRGVAEALDTLVERGFVHRQADPSDRRAVLVSVTEQGRDALQRADAEREVVAEEFFRTLRHEDRMTILRLLLRIDVDPRPDDVDRDDW